MVPKAQHTAEPKPFSPVGLLQTIGQFVFSFNHRYNILILSVWTAPWDVMMYRHTQWSLPLMATLSFFLFPCAAANGPCGISPGELYVHGACCACQASEHIWKARGRAGQHTEVCKQRWAKPKRKQSVWGWAAFLGRSTWQCRSCVIKKHFWLC